MPKYHMEKLICKNCQLKTEYQQWDNVNGLENPIQKAEILAGSFYSVICSHCKEKIELEHSCLYSDYKLGFLIYYSQNFEEQTFEKILSAEKRIDYKKLKLRLAIDFLDFREKIRILEDGFDDRALELAKTMIVSNIFENSQLELSRILYHSKNEQDNMLAFALVLKDKTIKLIKIPETFYVNFANMITELKLVDSEGIFETIDTNWALNLVTSEGNNKNDKGNKKEVKHAE